MVLSARSYDADGFDPTQRDLPSNFHTDGACVWPGAILHYLREYGLPPEPFLIQHIPGKGFEVGQIDEGARQVTMRKIAG